MTDWPVKTLGDVATITTGKIDVNAATENGAYPFFTCSRDVYRIDDAPFEGKAILVAGNGDLNVKYYEGRFNAYQRTYFLFARDENKCYPRYLFWFLENYLDVLRSGASGSTIKYIRLGDLSEASIAVPPLEEQKRIVELLDAATARVTELTACYEQARTHSNDLFTSALCEALEGNSDWPVKTLGEICEVFDDGDWIESKDQSSSGVRLIQTGNIGDGEFKDRSEKARFISESTFSRLRCTEIFPGDLLVSRLPDPVGRACLIPDTGSKMITSVDCTIMRPSKDLILSQFLVCSTQTSTYREQVRAKITGASRDRISRSNLAEVKVPMPPLDEQKRIVARLDSMRAKTSEMVAAYDAKLTAAKNLRQSILEAAFAGAL